ncbi:MAG: IS21 family transposase, partial [Bryobacteraceae bacterium]
PLIKKLVIEDRLTAVRVLEEIRAVGYAGGYSILKDLIREIRPRAIRRAHLRFETDLGEQAQVDLSPYTILLGGTVVGVVCFSMVLGYSRWLYIRFVLHADAHAVCHCHVLAFEDAGGVAHEILYDRMKQVVIESDAHGVVFHPLFVRLVEHYGFRAVPLEPGYKEGKGKVENTFKFQERNFLAGRSFSSIDDLNEQAKAWLETANARIHRTTMEKPLVRLEQERPHLIALAPSRFDAAVVVSRLVGDDFCIPWQTNRYSVSPDYTGHSALVRILEGRLEIEIGGNVVATHQLQSTKNGRYVLKEHEEAFRRRSTRRIVIEEQFLRLGAEAKAFSEGLIEQKGGSAGYHMSKILDLAERAGVQRVLHALRHAARYRAFDYRTVERIIDHKPAKLPSEKADLGLRTEHFDKYLKGAGSHQRSLDDYQKLEGRLPRENDDEDDDGK